MSTYPDGHEPGVAAHPLAAPDSLVARDDPEEGGVNHPVEPPSWLSNGSPPVAADKDTAAAADQGPLDAGLGGAAGSVGTESAAYAASSPFGRDESYGRDTSYGRDDAYAQAPVAQESSYMSSQYGYGQESGFSADPAPERAGPAVPPPPPPPSYQGQLPHQRRGDTAAFRAPRTRPAASAPSMQRRRANLVVARLEPWSVMKFSFLMSLVAWVVLFVGVALLYFVLSSLGVFHAVQSALSGVTSSQGSGGFNLGKYISASKVLGYTMLFGAVNIVLITALSTIGAMIYNLVTHLGGGIEVTLRESD